MTNDYRGFSSAFVRPEVIMLLLFPLTFTLFHFLCVLRKQILFLNSLIQDETSVELQSVRKFRQMNKCMKAPKTELLVCQDTSCD